MEHARNLAGQADAAHGEYGAPSRGAGAAVITPLACALHGVDIEIELTAGSRLAAVYGRDRATEHATCSYGLDPAQQAMADRDGLRIAALDDTGEARAVERPDHPWFVATLYQPQLRSDPGRPHPVFVGFVDAAGQ